MERDEALMAPSSTIHSTPPIQILIADDEESQRLGLAAMVKSWGYQPLMAADGQEALDLLEMHTPQAMITDLMMPRVDGYELLRRLKQTGTGPATIVLTAFGNIENAINTTVDLGAFWFLEKPFQPNALRLLLERAVNANYLRTETERLQRQLSYKGILVDMVGASAPMQEIFSLVRQVARSRAAVIVTGESGTGKELIAQAVHQLSPRKAGPFIGINCAAMPESLMESELFGHEKGAFTGAVERRAGCFELANGGTLLLDEIAEMPLATQAKLLRVLEESRVRRLGAKTEIPVDVRIVAATNRNPEDAVKNGLLREDLYYRLNVFHVELPPLRERLDDVPLIAESMIKNLNDKHACRVTDITPAALGRLKQHSWPGNVRELRNVVERAVILAGEGSIEEMHLPAALLGPAAVKLTVEDESGVRLAVGTTVSQAERALIELTLKHTRNNKTRAADILGISLKTLFNKLKEYSSEDQQVPA
jgi:DNA-binding NtrC family response regulator